MCECGRLLGEASQSPLPYIRKVTKHSGRQARQTRLILKHKQASNINTIYLARLYRSTDRCQYLYLWGERGRERERQREREREGEMNISLSGKRQETDQQFRTMG